MEVLARSMLHSPGPVVFLGSASPALSCKGNSLAPVTSSKTFLEEFVCLYLSVVLGGTQPFPLDCPVSSPVKPTFEVQYHSWPLSVGHCEAHRGSAESQWRGQGLSRSQYCLGSLP